MRKNLVVFGFFAVAGITVALIAGTGHPRAAGLVFFCLVLSGAFLPLWRKKFPPTSFSQDQSRKRFWNIFFGWILVFGAFLQLVLQYAKAVIYHGRLGIGSIIEFVFLMALGYFLIVPMSRRTNPRS